MGTGYSCKERVSARAFCRSHSFKARGPIFPTWPVPAPLRSIWWSIQGSQMTTTLCYGYAFVRASVSDASTCPSLNTAGGWQLPVFASVGARALVVENAASWHTSPGKTTCFDSQKRSSSYGTVSTLIASWTCYTFSGLIWWSAMRSRPGSQSGDSW